MLVRFESSSFQLCMSTSKDRVTKLQFVFEINLHVEFDHGTYIYFQYMRLPHGLVQRRQIYYKFEYELRILSEPVFTGTNIHLQTRGLKVD